MNALSRFFAPVRSTQGQSLIEVLIAVAIGVFVIMAAATLIAPALQTNRELNKIQVATGLGKELLENVRVFAEYDWHNIDGLPTGALNRYTLTTSTAPVASIVLGATGVETLMVGTTTYLRYFYLDEVMRGPGGDIVSIGGTTDPSTMKITVVYGWQSGSTSTLPRYFTRSGNRGFVQTDWSGGANSSNVTTTFTNQFATSSDIDFTSSTGSIIIRGF